MLIVYCLRFAAKVRSIAADLISEGATQTKMPAREAKLAGLQTNPHIH